MKYKILCSTLFVGLLLTFLTSTISIPAYAASKSSTSNDVHTIHWVDAKGHIVKTWRGTKVEAEIIEKTERAKLSKLLQVRKHGIPTPNINRVNNCGLPNEFFDLFNEGLVCFANAGTINNITIFDVYEVSSGNNHGQFSAYICGSGPCTGPRSFDIGYNTTYFPVSGYNWIVKSIHIY